MSARQQTRALSVRLPDAQLRRLKSRAAARAAASDDMVMRAAELKAEHRISYADGFAAATALELNAPLVTGDPELHALARELPQLQLHWLGA